MKQTWVLIAVGLTLAVSAGAVLLLESRAEPAMSPAPAGPRASARGALRDDLSEQLARVRASATVASLRNDLVALLAATAHEDPALSVQRATELKDEEGRLEALHECLPHWLARDREAARSWLLTHIGELPIELALSLLRDSAALDAQLALSVARQIPAGARPRAVREIFVAWAGSAPRQAAEAAAQLLEADGQVRVVGEVARVWAEQAPAEALHWATTLATPQARREALFPIVSRWAAHDAKAAAAALASVPDEGEKQHLVDTVAVQWARDNPLAARAWVEQLAPSPLRAAGATALLDTMLQTEPQRAAGWALELGDGPRSEVVEKTLTAWIARDPNAALDWANQQSEARGRNTLMALASERFRLQDAPAAEHWLAAHAQSGTGK